MSNLPIWSFSEMRESDLEWFLDIRNQVSKHLHSSAHFSLAEAKDWFRETKINYFVTQLRLEPENPVNIGYFRVRLLDSIGLAEIGFDLHPKYEGKNLAYLSYVNFVPKLRNLFDVEGLTLRVKTTNLRALNLYKRLGFIEVGKFRNEDFEDILMFNTVKTIEELPT